VGGTSLQLSSDGTIALETAWQLSGGGLVAKFQRPSLQQAATLPADAYRWAPDVSFVADPSTGVRVLYRGRWHQIGGTSLGAPGWAAAWALIRAGAQQAGITIGAAPSLIYKIGNSPAYAQAFHEITQGSNGLYDAGPGWNAVTGWGTPDVASLATAIQAVASGG
jgi:kumamolisin